MSKLMKVAAPWGWAAPRCQNLNVVTNATNSNNGTALYKLETWDERSGDDQKALGGH